MDSSENMENYNSTDSMLGYPYPSLYGWTHIIVSSVVVTCTMLVIVLGNGLVIVAIVIDRNLTGLQNWFIASLAVSDLFVGLFIMPLSLANELMGYWVFGDILCDLWLSTDVLLCTASILNLCLISLDRYWSITRAVTYIRQRTKQRALWMISIVWVTSVIVCLPPLFGWKRPQPTKLGYPLCVLSEETGYVFYSIICSFYLPLVIMVSVYIKIYAAARSRARRSLGRTQQNKNKQRQQQMSPSRKAIDMKCMSFFKKGFTLDLSDGITTSDCTDHEISYKTQQTVNEDISKVSTDDEINTIPILEKPAIGIVTCYNQENEDITGSPPPYNNDMCLESESQSTLLPLATYSSTTKKSKSLQNFTTEHLSHVNSCFKSDVTKIQVVTPGDVRTTTPLSNYRAEPTSSQENGRGTITQRQESQKLVQQPRRASENHQHLETKYRTFVAYETKRRKVRCTIAKDFNFTHAFIAARGKNGRGSGDSQRDLSNALADCERAKRRLARARERRATIVLGIVMASFIGCWLPFFSLYPITLVTGTHISPHVFSVIFWLGYCNSALNPIIYTIFNREFRQAFQRILRMCR